MKKKILKKNVLVLFALILTFSLAACTQDISKNGSTPVSSSINITKMKGEEILKAMNVETMTDITVFTEEDDSNKLLGRPNQYISKADFWDNRVSEKRAGSIEVFNNEEDCTTRKEYLEKIQSSLGILGHDYLYQYKNVLLRLESDLTPTQAEEYKNAFLSLQNG